MKNFILKNTAVISGILALISDISLLVSLVYAIKDVPRTYDETQGIFVAFLFIGMVFFFWFWYSFDWLICKIYKNEK